MKKVILMDIGNVLLDFDIRKLLTAVVTDAGVTSQEAMSFLLKTGIAEKYERGLVTSDQLFGEVTNGLKYKGTFDSFRTCWNCIFTENAGGVQAFHALKKDHRVILASNTNQMHFEHLEAEYSFIKLADDAVLSHRVHARKPDPDFFEKALAQAGVAAGEAFLIDDMKENIEGARKLGIAGHQFSGLPGLRADLTQYGITI